MPLLLMLSVTSHYVSLFLFLFPSLSLSVSVSLSVSLCLCFPLCLLSLCLSTLSSPLSLSQLSHLLSLSLNSLISSLSLNSLISSLNSLSSLLSLLSLSLFFQQKLTSRSSVQSVNRCDPTLHAFVFLEGTFPTSFHPCVSQRQGRSKQAKPSPPALATPRLSDVLATEQPSQYQPASLIPAGKDGSDLDNSADASLPESKSITRRLASSFKRRSRRSQKSHSDPFPHVYGFHVEGNTPNVLRLGLENGAPAWVCQDENHGPLSVIVTTTDVDALSHLELEALKDFMRHHVQELFDHDISVEDPQAAPGRHSYGRHGTLQAFFRHIVGGVRSGSDSSSGDSFSPGHRRRGSSTQHNEAGYVTGKPLDKLINEDRRKHADSRLVMPHCVTQMIQYLAANGLKSIGLFRVSGSTRRVHEMAQALDRGEELDFASTNPIEVAALLKYFLRLLPDPLLPTHLYALFTRASSLPELQQLQALQAACLLLPNSHRRLLRALLNLLDLVARSASGDHGNQMDATNLAVVMAPNLLQASTAPPSRTSSVGDAASLRDDEAVRAMQLLITHNDRLFHVSATMRDACLQFHRTASPQLVHILLKGMVDPVSASRTSSVHGLGPMASLRPSNPPRPSSAPRPSSSSPRPSSPLTRANSPASPSGSTYHLGATSPIPPPDRPRLQSAEFAGLDTASLASLERAWNQALRQASPDPRTRAYRSVSAHTSPAQRRASAGHTNGTWEPMAPNDRFSSRRSSSQHAPGTPPYTPSRYAPVADAPSLHVSEVLASPEGAPMTPERHAPSHPSTPMSGPSASALGVRLGGTPELVVERSQSLASRPTSSQSGGSRRSSGGGMPRARSHHDRRSRPPSFKLDSAGEGHEWRPRSREGLTRGRSSGGLVLQNSTFV
ncbi:RhoGAP domain-containing protein [Monosiga brevicollis MX1]|uniref:RhoGAP domain-containing protein n=1 Tax=Monosiga brevicollis TaxID=81824 RepID=A9UNM9_MONBE|nr:RhoGAP domain-containing protein [Monosiga brevicollis MX1]EDQ92730.1 RhoGAP domain-containing protein [Monosiga brevicollis MX1]|eukprot:XP_001742492.1 RhoGAP domain-containing protein [Monosiga brevicollis MX1]